jgi:fatty-acyl-CoA synthase
MFDSDLLRERARLTPEKIALVLVENGERITYADLDRRIEAAARLISSRGVAAGDRYGVLAFNCVEFIELVLAAGRIGAIAVPLSTRATAHELRGIIADCDMRVLFFGPDFAELARELMAERAIEISAPRPEPFEMPPHVEHGEDVWCLLYTSGTTGRPKGVMIPRRQLFWNGYNTAVNWGLREDDVTPLFTPLYHAGGLAAFLLPIFTVGGTVVLHRGFDPAEIWRIVESEGCTVMLGVPTIYKLLMDGPQFATVDLSRVRWFISGGAPLPTYIIEAYQKRGVVMKQGYGMTEVGVNCFSMTVEDSFRKPGSIGRPLMFTEIRIVDGDGREVAAGDVGEMLIRGPHVSLGYWNNPQATRETYLEGGWLRTGDLARRDEEGFFYIAGRRKEMFISGGVNVYPAEIEAELVAHPQVSDAAVVAIEDATWGEVAVAFIVGQASGEELTAYLLERLSKYKVPKRFIFMEALPRTPYGKVVKDELRKAIV